MKPIINFGHKKQTMPKIKLTVAEQVKAVLDGRTQRWLALEIKMPEDVLSRKLKGVAEFTKEEIDSINNRLGCNIQL